MAATWTPWLLDYKVLELMLPRLELLAAFPYEVAPASPGEAALSGSVASLVEFPRLPLLEGPN